MCCAMRLTCLSLTAIYMFISDGLSGVSLIRVSSSTTSESYYYYYCAGTPTFMIVTIVLNSSTGVSIFLSYDHATFLLKQSRREHELAQPISPNSPRRRLQQAST